MQKYVCEPCGYVYDPELGDPDNGVEPGTAFEDLPEDWVCPICGVGKDEFAPEEASARFKDETKTGSFRACFFVVKWVGLRKQMRRI